MTHVRTLGISEARRLLPELVERIAGSGGRVDITRRGRVAVSIVRTADLDEQAQGQAARATEAGLPAALRMELVVAEDELEVAMEKVRAGLWSTSEETRRITEPLAQAPSKKSRARRGGRAR